MKFVALVSGGKDSILSTMLAIAHGHDLVCIAQLIPGEKKSDVLGKEELQEIDSFCFQTVGHHAVPLIAQCLGVPLRQGVIYENQRQNEGLYYKPEDVTASHTTGEASLRKSTSETGDEVEVMFQLLLSIKEEFPGVEAVSSGAILSDYQRTRVESCCRRLRWRSLAYMWQLEAIEVLDLVQAYDVDARLIKCSTMGLDPRKHLGKSLNELREYLDTQATVFHVAGEGGEFETLVLDAPIFIDSRLQLNVKKINVTDDNPYAPVGHLIFQVTLVKKSEEERATSAALMESLKKRMATKLEAKGSRFRTYLETLSEVKREKTVARLNRDSVDEDQVFQFGSEETHGFLFDRRKFPDRYLPMNVQIDSMIDLTINNLPGEEQAPGALSLGDQCTKILSRVQEALGNLDRVFFIMIHVGRH